MSGVERERVRICKIRRAIWEQIKDNDPDPDRLTTRVEARDLVIAHLWERVASLTDSLRAMTRGET